MHEFILFVRQLFRMLHFVRGVLLTLLLMLLALSLITSKVDNIPLTDAVYFVLITALTIGFGDITPGSGITRIISIVAGFIGVVFVGLVVAISTRALKLAVEEEGRLQKGKADSDRRH